MEVLRRKMADVYHTFSGRIDDDKIFPIPGLIETVAEEDGISTALTGYIPQGLCRAGDYLLITAYDVSKQHNSVIYAVDTADNRLVSTLTMPNRYHAGGIAFDGENIWMTGDTSDNYSGDPFVQYMTYNTFLEHASVPVSSVDETELSEHIYIQNKPSFLDCDEGILWVGTYAGAKDTSDGYANGYKIIGEPGAPRLNTMMYSIITGIDSSSQGMDIDEGYLYVSSSYNGHVKSVKSSFVTKYSLSGAGIYPFNYDVRGSEISRVEVPKMNEEILVEDSEVRINFESGADYWRFCVIRTDRVLPVSKSLWRNPL